MTRWLVVVFSLGIGFLSFSLGECGVTVIVTRHAEKAESPAADPELSPAGQRRAQLLAWMLASAGLNAIYSSEARRTRDTAQPLAERSGLPITSFEAIWMFSRSIEDSFFQPPSASRK